MGLARRHLLAGIAAVSTAWPLGAASGGAEVAPIALGETLPPLRGERLSGRRIVLPDSSLGAPVLLLLGFSYASRHDVEAWAERFRRGFGSEPGITYFEVPVIGGAGRLARPFIDRGMRRGTPRELHDRVVTVYRDAGRWRQRVGVSDADVAYLLLVDRRGRLAYRSRGPLTEGGERELAEQVRRVLEEP